jgi:preprotein translocase SecE subunit
MNSGASATVSDILISSEGVQPVEAESVIVVRKFERTYLQGGVAAGVLLIGAIIVLWFCYSNKRFSEFLIATEGEMKKVNWSSRREVFGSTWVVIAISVMIATLLFVTDIIFKSIAEGINLIQS